jgi:hypothetical protein
LDQTANVKALFSSVMNKLCRSKRFPIDIS